MKKILDNRTMTETKEYLNLKEVAAYLGMTMNSLYKVMKEKGDFPVTRFSKRLIRVNKSQLDAWIIRQGMNETIKTEGAEHYE